MIRAITHDELEAFCGLGADPQGLYRQLTGMFDSTMSAPEYCHVWVEDGKMIAGVAYIRFAAAPGDFELWRIFRLDALGEMAAAVQFLQQSFHLLTRFYARRLEAQVRSQDGDAAEQRALFTACGFQTVQIKARYEFHPGSTAINTETRLHLEPFAALGKGGFVNLIADATRDTLDRSQRAEYRRLGAQPWAEQFYALLLSLGANQSRWRAAIVDGHAVGFVIPQMLGTSLGAINYIGVIPAQRGKGISHDLLRVGTAELLQAGAKRVIAEIEIENFPLAKSLAAIGYEKVSELGCYQIESLAGIDN